MFVLNFIWVVIYAFVAEALRRYFPLWGKFYKTIKMSSGHEPKKVEDATIEVKAVIEMKKEVEKSAADIDAQKKESERFNDQDNYVKYAKM